MWSCFFRASEEDPLFPIVVGSFWACVEYMVITIAGTMPNVATPLYVVPLLLQPISVVGCHGLNFAIGAFNGCVAQALSTTSTQRRKQVLRRLLVGTCLWAGLSVVQYSTADSGTGGRRATVAAVAPGGLLPSAVLTCKERDQKPLRRGPSLHGIIEGADRSDTSRGERHRGEGGGMERGMDETFAPLAKEMGILLTIGMHTKDRSNLAVTISPEGEVLGYYGKMNPVKLLGEQSPKQYGYRDFSVQGDWLGYHASSVRVGPLICYDMDFPESAATLGRQGVEMILSPSSDWSAMRNHIAAYVFRAIENRMPIVKADTGWDSAIIDARGNVVASYMSRESVRHAVVGTVGLGSGEPTMAALYVVYLLVLMVLSLTASNSNAPTLFLLCLSSIVLFNIRTVHIGLPYLLELWPVSLFCLSPLLAAQRLSNSIWPPVMTFFFALGITFWNMGLDIGLGLLIGLGWGISWWLAGLFESLAFKSDSGYYSLHVAAMWVSLMYATARFLGTMESLSTPFHGSPVLIQPIALFGFYSLEFAVMCSNAALAQALTSLNPRHVLNLWQLGVLGWTLFSVLLYYTSMIPGQATVTVAAVSPGGYLPSPLCEHGYLLHYGERVSCAASVDEQLARTRTAVEEYGAKIVVWPEAWLGLFENMSAATGFVERELGPLAKELHISMTVGAETETWGNLALTIGPNGVIQNVYGKQHPIRISGEKSKLVFGYPTIPLNPALVDQHVDGLPAPPRRLRAARELVSEGSTLILNPSQDWAAVRSHFATAVFRAVENRVAIVKADVGWDSAIIDPLGNKVVGFERDKCTEEVIVGTVSLGTGTTLAVYLGDLVAVSCLMFVALALVQATGQRVTRRRHGELDHPFLSSV
ncbi:hypothetical protein FOZ60_002099 [Perkinsus olseni]|uniref:CN hydrolase domain-containing protein n=1 Tax=Perkinsus olseni TaxID=32597 RepID=A0A7J6NZZ0_PEROL|nr:hypothetical protein FOZ60_002099 [Perkinsus olseni]